MLRQAGFDPDVIVSGVDETVVDLDGPSTAGALADRKAEAVAAAAGDALVLGCDTVVEVGGRMLGQPSSADEAAEWWRSMRNATAQVWTGHCLVDAGGESASWIAEATVTFGDATDAEIDRYVATGEPLGAAGAFRLDGRAAAFIERIDGDPGTIHGVSIRVLRMLLRELDVEVSDLWSERGTSE